MQRYGKFLKWMFNLSFLLLKMRELTQNEHKITNFIHFNRFSLSIVFPIIVHIFCHFRSKRNTVYKKRQSFFVHGLFRITSLVILFSTEIYG